MRILLIILLFAQTSLNQITLVYDSPHEKDYVFDASVYRTSDTVLYTTKRHIGNTYQLRNIIGNCRTHYFLVLTSATFRGSISVFDTPRRPVSVLATYDTPEFVILNYACLKDVTLVIEDKPIIAQ